MTLAMIVSAAIASATPGIPEGASKLELSVDGRTLAVYTYKPATYTNGPLILVFHGLARNAEEYRDHAKGLADRLKAIVAAPEFDEERFPYERYSQGGLTQDGAVRPRVEWTWSLVPRIADALRRQEGRLDNAVRSAGSFRGGPVRRPHDRLR